MMQKTYTIFSLIVAACAFVVANYFLSNPNHRWIAIGVGALFCFNAGVEYHRRWRKFVKAEANE